MQWPWWELIMTWDQRWGPYLAACPVMLAYSMYCNLAPNLTFLRDAYYPFLCLCWASTTGVCQLQLQGAIGISWHWNWLYGIYMDFSPRWFQLLLYVGKSCRWNMATEFDLWHIESMNCIEWLHDPANTVDVNLCNTMHVCNVAACVSRNVEWSWWT